MLDLLELHLNLFILVLGKETEGVEAAVAVGVFITIRFFCHPRLALENASDGIDNEPIFDVNLVKTSIDDGRRLSSGGKGRLKADSAGNVFVEDLGKWPASGCEHRETSVLDLGLTLQFFIGRIEGVW